MTSLITGPNKNIEFLDMRGRNVMMAAEEGRGVSNVLTNVYTRLDRSSLIPFRCPEWFLPYERDSRKYRKPGKECWNHDFCEQADDTLQILSGKKKAGEEKRIEKKMFQPEIGPPSWGKTQNTIWTIYEGDKYNLEQLLSSQTRDFLIKFGDDQQQIKINQLSNKHVVLYVAWLCEGKVDFLYERDLREVYNDLYPKEQFEVVFIALGNDEEIFHSSFSNMPWLAIPYEDQEARQLLKEKFAIPHDSSPRLVLFAPDGTLLDINSQIIFHIYGAEGFPFTKEKLEVEIEHDDDALLKKLYMKQLSLAELLGDSVISCEGEKVSTSNLEGKTVGLHFVENTPWSIRRTRDLKWIWKSLMSRGDTDFEIVLIYMRALDHSLGKPKYMDELENLPWYTLHGSGKKLRRAFKVRKLRYEISKDAGYLIIIEPDGPPRTLNYFAFDIFYNFGIHAYPFTLEKAVSLRKSELEETLVLNRLLSPLAPLRRGYSTNIWEEDIVVSNLSCKRVLLLFATHSSYESGKFLRELKKMYFEMRGTNDHFEVIYISLDCDKSVASFPKCIKEMPWLVHSFVPNFAACLVNRLFDREFPAALPAIAAFGPDWHLVGKESNLAFKEDWSSEFPFVKPYSVEEEVITNYKFDLERFFPGISSTN